MNRYQSVRATVIASPPQRVGYCQSLNLISGFFLSQYVYVTTTHGIVDVHNACVTCIHGFTDSRKRLRFGCWSSSWSTACPSKYTRACTHVSLLSTPKTMSLIHDRSNVKVSMCVPNSVITGINWKVFWQTSWYVLHGHMIHTRCMPNNLLTQTPRCWRNCCPHGSLS